VESDSVNSAVSSAVRAASASSTHTASGSASTTAGRGAIGNARVLCRTASAGGDLLILLLRSELCVQLVCTSGHHFSTAAALLLELLRHLIAQLLQPQMPLQPLLVQQLRQLL
jgi:hypothetical protein